MKKLLISLLGLSPSLAFAQPAARFMLPFETQKPIQMPLDYSKTPLDTAEHSSCDLGQGVVTVAIPPSGISSTTGAILFMDSGNTCDSSAQFFGRDGSTGNQNYFSRANAVGISVGVRGSERSPEDICEYSITDELRGLGKVLTHFTNLGTPLDSRRTYLVAGDRFGATRALQLLQVAPHLFAEAYISDAPMIFSSGQGWVAKETLPLSEQSRYSSELSLRSPADTISLLQNSYQTSLPKILLMHGTENVVVPLSDFTHYRHNLEAHVGASVFSETETQRRFTNGNYTFIEFKNTPESPHPCAVIDTLPEPFSKSYMLPPTHLIYTIIPTNSGTDFLFENSGILSDTSVFAIPSASRVTSWMTY